MTEPSAVEAADRSTMEEQVRRLRERADALLCGDPRTNDLASALPSEDDGPLRIAFWGPYSAGKSTLIAALLRLPYAAVDEVASAEPKTTEATAYDWNGAVLLDLPGTLAGIEEHTDKARSGMRGADLLAIVTTSELAGEAETAAILRALDSDGFVDRSIVVVNKMNADNSDPNVVVEGVRQRLGSFSDRVPIVATDARDYIDAVNHADLETSERTALLEESGIAELQSELERLLSPGVDTIRPVAQAFVLRHVLTEAISRWQLQGDELAAAEAAMATDEAISNARQAVFATLDNQSEALASVIKAGGGSAANSISVKQPNVPEDVAGQVDSDLQAAISDLEARLAASVQAAFDSLASQYGEVVSRPETWTFDLDVTSMTSDESSDDESQLRRNVLQAIKDLAKEGGAQAGRVLQKVADSGGEQGSIASNVATRINQSRVGQKLLGGEAIGAGPGKFKPYGRGKAADKVAGAAGKLQWAMVVIGPTLDLTGIADEQLKRRKLDKRRAEIAENFDAAADRSKAALRSSFTQWFDEWVVRVERSLSDQSSEGKVILAGRDAALAEINSLLQDAERLVGSNETIGSASAR